MNESDHHAARSAPQQSPTVFRHRERPVVRAALAAIVGGNIAAWAMMVAAVVWELTLDWRLLLVGGAASALLGVVVWLPLSSGERRGYLRVLQDSFEYRLPLHRVTRTLSKSDVERGRVARRDGLYGTVELELAGGRRITFVEVERPDELLRAIRTHAPSYRRGGAGEGAG